MYKGINDIEENGRVDWFMVIIYLICIVLGWLNIYAASFDLENAVAFRPFWPCRHAAGMDGNILVACFCPAQDRYLLL